MSQSNDSGLNLDHLEALARVATTGPWLHRHDPGNPAGFQHCVKMPGEFGTWICDCLDNADRSVNGGVAGERNASFIAAANPAAVLELIALARRAAPVPAPIAKKDLTHAVDAAMVEMSNIHPPLRRSECERLIRAALANQPAPTAAPEQAASIKPWQQRMSESGKRECADLAVECLMAEVAELRALVGQPMHDEDAERASQPSEAAPLDAYEMTRLRRLMSALGHADAFELSDDYVRGVMCTVLGQAAGKLERAALAAALAHQPAQEQAEPRFTTCSGCNAVTHPDNEETTCPDCSQAAQHEAAANAGSHKDCCDTPFLCSAVRRCTAKDEVASPVVRAQSEESASWGRVETVGDMVRNLLTLDQAGPVFAAFHTDLDGKRVCRTRPVTISRERVVDGKWVDPSRTDVSYAHIVWAKQDEAAGAQQAHAGADERAEIAGEVLAETMPGEWLQVLDEVARATLKFPTWPTDPLHAVAVLGEEFGELTKAVLQTAYEPHKVEEGELRTEAVQTAAMALRFVASLDRYEFTRCAQHSQGRAAIRAAQEGGAA